MDPAETACKEVDSGAVKPEEVRAKEPAELEDSMKGSKVKVESLQLNVAAEPFTPAGLSNIVNHLSRPQTESCKFDGDCLSFNWFMCQFSAQIVNHMVNDEERLTYLEQLTSGDPNHIVRSYGQLPDATSAYRGAMAELHRRYGNPDLVAAKYVCKALDWHQVKAHDWAALDKYVVFLEECLHAVNGMGNLRVLEYPENLRRILMKMPFHLQDKWRSVVHGCSLMNEVPDFARLVGLLKQEVEKGTHPLYGKVVLSGAMKGGKEKRSSFAGVVQGSHDVKQTSSVSKCCYCRSSAHSLGLCDKFRLLDHPEKLKFVRTAGLCFACLGQGHLLKNLDYHVNEVFFWTDRMAVLQFIWNKSTHFHTFVANRLSQIHEATTLDQWRHMPSKDNPADLASRGASAQQLVDSSWFEGPLFLWKQEVDWPQTPRMQPIPVSNPEVEVLCQCRRGR